MKSVLRSRVPGPLWVVLAACLLLTAASAGAQNCNNVGWLNPSTPPPFLNDVNQAAGTGNCQFHEFASQNFLSLVLGASPAFASWPTGNAVFPASGTPSCAGSPPGTALDTILNKIAPSPNLPGASLIEATGQPLVDQNGRYVQFEYRVNPLYCQVVRSCALYNQTCVTAAGSANPAFRFPSGSQTAPGVTELKLAWRVMETCNLPDSPKQGCKKDNLSQFFWTGPVTVSPYSPKNPTAVQATIGLIGFHLIQKTPSHPEFIWATWEQISNAPVCPGSGAPSCTDPSKSSSGVSTKSGWSLSNPPITLCNEGTCPNPSPPANCANQDYYCGTNGQPDPNQPNTQVCRVFPCGSTTTATGPNNANITALNQAIRNKLTPNNVWWNYFLVGTLWGVPPITSNSFAQAGSLQLANTTMETYAQLPTVNCFSCHSYSPTVTWSSDPAISVANIDFTHILVHALQTQATSCPSTSTCAGPSTASTGTPALIRSSKRK